MLFAITIGLFVFLVIMIIWALTKAYNDDGYGGYDR